MSGTPEWNAIDQYSETFPIYNCAFLDMLGYRQRAIDYFNHRFNLYGRIERALNDARTAQVLISPVLDTNNLSIQIISDSIIMTQPAEAGLGTMFLFACIFVARLNMEGLLVRGGISQGRHCVRRSKLDYTFIASEPLQKAYVLESERALYPRVLIDAELITNLRPEERVFVVRERDEYILHFAHHIINRSGNNVSDVRAEIQEIHEKKSQIASRCVKKKYQWLLDYYFWTISQNPNWQAREFRKYASKTDHGFRLLE